MASPAIRPVPGPERIHGLGPDRRREAYEEGELRRDELTTWAVHYPDEVPLLNGELPWIAANLE